MMASWLMTCRTAMLAPFSPEYRLAILAEYDRLTEPGPQLTTL